MRRSSSPAAPDRFERVEQQPADWIPILRPRLPDAKTLLPYLQRIDDSRIYTNWGPLASELENRLSHHWHMPDGSVISASSGTAALVGAILASAGRAHSQRPLAIVPAFTFVATALAAEQCGYRPYIADIDPATWHLDFGRLNPNVVAQAGVVVIAAPFGRGVPQADCAQFHSRTQIPIVIDGGASFENLSQDPRSYIGDFPVALSFHATKCFSTGEGGCVVTTSTAAADRVTEALNFGSFRNRECASPSINGKMSEYHAAVGLAELDAWSAKLTAFRSITEAYRRHIASTGLTDRFIGSPTVASCYALWRCADIHERKRTEQALNQANVDCRRWYGDGLQAQPYYRDSCHDELTTTNLIAPLTVGLPVAPDLPDSFIERIVNVLASVAARHRGM